MSLWLVLLAAGRSRRLGRPKQLVEVQGQPLVQRTARMGLALCDGGVLVAGHQAAAVQAAVADLALRVVEHPQWPEGMGSSLAAGIRALPDSASGALIMPCDLARLESRELAGLVSAWRQHPDRAAASRYGAVVGTPAIFPRPAFDELASLSGSRGAASLLARWQALEVEVPSAAFDLDQPEDLAELLGGDGAC